LESLFASNVSFYASNASSWATAASTYASNTSTAALAAVADYSSNAGFFSSNAAFFASNAAFFASNGVVQLGQAVFPSLGFSSNTAAYASNLSPTVAWSSNEAAAAMRQALQPQTLQFNSNGLAAALTAGNSSTGAEARVALALSNDASACLLSMASSASAQGFAVQHSDGLVHLRGRVVSMSPTGAPGAVLAPNTNAQLEYPPAAGSGGLQAPSWTLSNVLYGWGAYAAAASSSNAGSSPHHPFQAANPSLAWTSSTSAYTSVSGHAQTQAPTQTVSQSQVYVGEWLQLDLPEAIVPTAYTVLPSTQSLDGQPVRFVLLAAPLPGDAAPWTLVDGTYASADVPVRNSLISITVPPAFSSAGTAFRAFRLVVLRVATSAAPPPTIPAVVSRLQLFGQPVGASLALSRSAALVSGRLGVGAAAPVQRLDVRGSAFVSSNVGVGVEQPAAALHLSRDSAMKPSTSTWTVSSDRRLKRDIVDADLERCYGIVRAVPLRRFEWSDAMPEEAAPDRRRLGWIAQEVETAFPKAVERVPMFGLDDCRALNADQLVAALYGCVQRLQQHVEKLLTRVAALESPAAQMMY
jgi:hypothetical protein